MDCSVVDYTAATNTHSTDAHKIDGNWGTTGLHFRDLDMAILSVNPAGSKLEHKFSPIAHLGYMNSKTIIFLAEIP